MKEWIKKNWKICLICLFVLLWFSKCTQSCSRKQIIKQNEITIVKQDSIINYKDSLLHDLSMKYESTEQLLNSERNHTANYSTIATGNQATLINKIKELEKSNSYLNNIIKKYDAIIKKYDTTIKKYELENKLLKDSLKNK